MKRIIVLSFAAFLSTVVVMSAEPTSEAHKILKVINKVADDKKFDKSSYSKSLDALPPEAVARIAVVAKSLESGDAANTKQDKKWSTLFWMSLNNIRGREKADPEELLSAIRFVQTHTLQDGGVSLTLEEMTKEVEERKRAKKKNDKK